MDYKSLIFITFGDVLVRIVICIAIFKPNRKSIISITIFCTYIMKR